MSERRQQPDRRAPIRGGGRRADDPPPLWVSIRTYAQQHETTRQTVYKWIEAGLIDTWRVGQVIRVKNQPPADRRP